MDGHVLILSGLILFISYQMMLREIPYGAAIGVVVAIGMLVYCAMIFPFLKSLITIIISILLLIACIINYMPINFSN